MTGFADMARRGVNLIPARLRRKVKKAIPIPVKERLQHLLLAASPRTGTFECADGRHFVRTRELLFARLILEGDYEPELSTFVRRFVRPGDICVDLGANFGWYATLMGSAVGPSGRVYAFEPTQRAFELLESNVEINGMASTVSTLRLAVGETAGWVRMQGEDPEMIAYAFARETDEDNSTVRMVRLDDELARHLGQIAYMKVDIEGFESKALAGGGAILSSAHAPLLQIELNDEALRRSGSSRVEVSQTLAQHGYRLFEVGVVPHVLRPASPDASDVFAIPPCGRFHERSTAMFATLKLDS